MSADPRANPGAPIDGPGGPAGQLSEEELRAAYEAELSRITSEDMILQSAVSLLNIGGRRLGPIGDRPARTGESPQSGPSGAAERDLEQVRDAIDAVRALLEILERRHPQDLRPLRDALSQLQMAYAREVKASAAAHGHRAPGAGDGEPEAAQSDDQAGGAPEQAQPAGKQNPQPAEAPGPAEASGRLWVPGR